eukprot:TRINITY_DN53527_c0_g1_i1.p1 TRINITY_DN53527_c0_g1~~TRINITY_DN53527_c0_g1_i1.p1  ORF type:complete len:145 (+),score=33.25 TRINITY_DN53527_c0_g1_i1:85-519(+)
MIRQPPRSTLSSSSAASDVYKRQSLVVARVTRNVQRFQSNYLVLFCISLVLVVLANPFFLVCSAALALGYKWSSTNKVVLKGYEMTDTDKRVALGGVTLVLNWFCGTSAMLLLGASIGAIGIGAHATMRDEQSCVAEKTVESNV